LVRDGSPLRSTASLPSLTRVTSLPIVGGAAVPTRMAQHCAHHNASRSDMPGCILVVSQRKQPQRYPRGLTNSSPCTQIYAPVSARKQTLTSHGPTSSSSCVQILGSPAQHSSGPILAKPPSFALPQALPQFLPQALPQAMSELLPQSARQVSPQSRALLPQAVSEMLPQSARQAPPQGRACSQEMQHFVPSVRATHGPQTPFETPETLVIGKYRADLAEGYVVELGNRKLRLECRLGKGSFASVWGGMYEDGSKVALKEVMCTSPTELCEAEFEGDLLNALSAKDFSHELRVPIFFAMETRCLGQSSWQYLLAMSHVPGKNLSTFLVRKRHTYRFMDAVFLVRQLLMQLAPTFERVAPLAFHRDVTPRNILIEEREAAEGVPSFMLIDFGAAQDSLRWRLGFGSSAVVRQQSSPAGDGGWATERLGGDARCWPTSSWTIFAAGCDALAVKPALLAEYMNLLDFHAFGITALQVLSELSVPFSEAEIGCAGAAATVFSALQVLESAWGQYWEHAVLYWRGIFETCRDSGDIQAVRKQYKAQDVRKIIRQDLCLLRGALLGVQHACEVVPGDIGLSKLASLVQVLLMLIHMGDKSDSTVSWRSISELLQSGPSPSPSHRLSPSREPARESLVLEREAPRCGALSSARSSSPWLLSPLRSPKQTPPLASHSTREVIAAQVDPAMGQSPRPRSDSWASLSTQESTAAQAHLALGKALQAPLGPLAQKTSHQPEGYSSLLDFLDYVFGGPSKPSHE